MKIISHVYDPLSKGRGKLRTLSPLRLNASRYYPPSKGEGQLRTLVTLLTYFHI